MKHNSELAARERFETAVRGVARQRGEHRVPAVEIGSVNGMTRAQSEKEVIFHTTETSRRDTIKLSLPAYIFLPILLF